VKVTKSFQIKPTARQLLGKARTVTGINIIDATIETRLGKLLHSLNTEAELHEVGVAGMERHLLRVLCDRLRMQRDFDAHPEINDQKIIRPLFISCIPRTGSTKTHKMLGASGDFLRLPFWMGYNLALRSGRRGEDPSVRIQDADSHVCWFNTHAPHARQIHEFSTFETEEESLLFEPMLFAPYLAAYVYVPSYTQWYMTTQDISSDLAFMKLGLKYLQWQFHDGDFRPWVLKCPSYPGMEAMLTKLFPDACFVATHRDPAATLSSVNSLLYYYNVAYSLVDRRKILGPITVEGMAMQLEQSMTVRDSNPDLNLIDIGYTEITNSGEKIIEKIYAHAGMKLSDKARQAMRDWERDNVQHKLGVHKHSLEDYGLTREIVHGRFSNYIERFQQYF
jgi:Sulfotransferase family